MATTETANSANRHMTGGHKNRRWTVQSSVTVACLAQSNPWPLPEANRAQVQQHQFRRKRQLVLLNVSGSTLALHLSVCAASRYNGYRTDNLFVISKYIMKSPEFREPEVRAEDREKIGLGVEIYKIAEEAADEIDNLFDQAIAGAAITPDQLSRAAKSVRQIVFRRGCKAINLNEDQVRAVLSEC